MFLKEIVKQMVALKRRSPPYAKRIDLLNEQNRIAKEHIYNNKPISRNNIFEINSELQWNLQIW